MTTEKPLTAEEARSQMNDWMAGRRSWTNGYPPEVAAAMDAQEVVKLSAYIATLAAQPDVEALDVERLAEAIQDELVVLWGEPSDAFSERVRPIVARNIAERYRAAPGKPE